VHDLSAEDARASQWLPWRTRRRYQLSFRTSARFAAQLVTVSEFSRQSIIERYGVPPDRVHVAYPAVDPELATHLDRGGHTRPAAQGPATVLAVGNVLPRKNLVTLAHAVHALADQGRDIRLRIAGRVPEAGAADAATMKGLLGERVDFTGYLTTEQLAQEYLNADVFAFPSWYEGFGIPVLEAMYAGKPVVLSDQTSLPEAAGDAALVVPAGDVLAWTDAIARTLEDHQLRDELVTAGRERARSFSWDDTASVVANALRAAAVRRGV
jgi:glycosyltransferase involved in cell wall biosynthesis